MLRTTGFLVFMLCSAAVGSAAPNVANVSQKGSLLIFTDVSTDLTNTLIRIQNDGARMWM